MSLGQAGRLERAGRASIAYRARPGGPPTLLFLPGYASDMEGSKALALDAHAARRGLAMVRFDYSGTGGLEGVFEDGTLDLWLEEALAVVDRLTAGPLILVGSSMGGWIALHVALRRPQRVHALLGIAAAPDFSDWGFTGEQKAVMERDGRLSTRDRHSERASVVTHAFWRSAEALRLLDGGIDIRCPVRLVHGEQDREVPTAVALRLMERLRSADVQLNIIKGGGHRLSEPHEIATILRTIDVLLELA